MAAASSPSTTTTTTTTPEKPPSFPKAGGFCTDENNYPRNQETKKQPTTPTASSSSSSSSSSKHFMSPTIAAASKANPPRKKVLADRNRSPVHSAPHLLPAPKTTGSSPNLDYSSRTMSSGNGEGGEKKEQKPYDPLTNYLSPRPKFLRYNPGRRREILLRGESSDVGGSKDRFSFSPATSLESMKGFDDGTGDSADSPVLREIFLGRKSDEDGGSKDGLSFSPGGSMGGTKDRFSFSPATSLESMKGFDEGTGDSADAPVLREILLGRESDEDGGSKDGLSFSPGGSMGGTKDRFSFSPATSLESMKGFDDGTGDSADSPALREILLGRESDEDGGSKDGLSFSPGRSVASKKAVDDAGDSANSPLPVSDGCEKVTLKGEGNGKKEGEDGLSFSPGGSLESNKGVVDGLGDSASSPVPVSNVRQESNVKEEGEEVDESDEEFEDVEIERGGGWWRGGLKFLLLLVLLMISTCYISSMNSAEPSPVVHAVGSLKDRYYMIQDEFYGYMKSLQDGNYNLLVERKGVEMGLIHGDGVKEEDISDASQTEDVVESCDDVTEGKGEGEKGVEMGLIHRDGVEEEEISDDAQTQEVVESCDDVTEGKGEGEVEGAHIGFLGCEDGEIMETVEHGEEGIDEELVNVTIELPAEESAIAGDLRLGKEGDSENMEAVGREEEESVDVWDDTVVLQAEENTVDNNLVLGEGAEDSSDQPGETEAKELLEMSSMVDGSAGENTSSGVPQFVGDQDTEEMGGTEMAVDNADYKAVIADAERNLREWVAQHRETDFSLVVKAFTGILATLIVSLALGSRLKKKRNGRKDSPSVVEQPRFESVIARKSSSVLRNEADKNADSSVSLANSNSMSRSIEEEVTKGAYKTRPPSVELLDEFVVEEMGSSSLRNCGMNSRIVDMEVSSHSSSFMENGTSIKAHSVPVQAQPAFSGISTVNSPSSGGFTTEKKTDKTEKKGRREPIKVEETTPLRRSSRLRNRAIVASP